MSSIIENQINTIMDFANETPSEEQLAEYVKWKNTNRAELLSIIEGLAYEVRLEILYEFYVTTLEYKNSKHVTLLIDEMLVNHQIPFTSEIKVILNIARYTEGDHYPLVRTTQVYDRHNRFLQEMRDYIDILLNSRLPIFNDLKCMISAPDIKSRILSNYGIEKK
jgi:hypothetical protein